MANVSRVLFFLGVLSAQAFSQVPDDLSFTIRNWTGVGFNETLVSADGVLITHSRGGMDYRSLDTGKTWRPFPVPGEQSAFPLSGPYYDSASGLLYGFSSSGVYTASPRANGWARIHDMVVLEFSIDGSTLIFSNESNVDISRDGGRTYKRITAEILPNRGVVLASRSCVYIGNYQSPMTISCDGGNTWKSPSRDTLSNSASYLVSVQGAVIALTNHGLIRSLDSGKSWSRWLGNLGNDSSLRTLSLSETSLIATRWDTSDYSRSVDGGRTWVTYPFPDPESFNGMPPPFVAMGQKLAFISSYGLLVSGNGGLTWSEANTRKIKGAIQNLAVEGGAFLALTEQGIFASGDTGITWDQSLPAPPDAPWTALIASGGVVAAGGSDGVVRLSSDAGAHWSRPLPLPASQPVASLAIFGGSALAASDSGVWRLSVPDSTWKIFPLPAAGSFKVLGSGPNAMLIATESHLWRMRPNGSYDDLSAGIPINKITGLWIIDDRAFAYTSDGYLRIWDAGNSAWVSIRKFDRHIVSLAGSQNCLAATTYMGFYVSDDWGATWNGNWRSWIGSGFFSRGEAKTVAVHGGYLYVADELGGVWEAYIDTAVISPVLPGLVAPKAKRNHSPLGILRARGLRVDGRISPGLKNGLPKAH